MDLSTVRGRRRRSLFRPWNSYLAKKGAVEAAALARQLDAHRARAHAGLAPHLTPLVRLTVKLIDTYEGINSAYYERRTLSNDQHSPSNLHRSQPDSSSDSHNVNAFARNDNVVHPTSTTATTATAAAHSAEMTSTTTASTATTTANPSTNAPPVVSPLSIQYCDENFDYIVRTGEMFNNRYMLEKVIGRGSFGQVVRAFDTRDNTHVAIKIIKNNSLYVEQALSEVRMTSYLNSIDPEDEHSIMRLRDKFIFRGHQCLVLELLSFSLYDLLRSTEFYGVSLNLVRKFCKQILKCLAFLSRSDINIAHCDLKPENVLLRHPQRSAIKVVDFGASCRISESMFVYVQSRFYRAPEVILGLPYATQVDVWSLGCMLIELHTGYPVFAGKDEGDQIAIIVERLGLPPTSMLERGKKTHLFFDRHSVSGEWSLKPSISEEHGAAIPGSKPIRAFVDFHTGASNGRRKRVSGGHSEEDYEVFLALADKMLRYDSDVRISANSALNDSFLRGASAARSGRESPPPMPASMGVIDHVPHTLDPGRKAPVQRMRASQRLGPSETTEPADAIGGKLRLSKSEPALDPVPKRTHVFPQSDWAEEAGIEPPPWRAGNGLARGQDWPRLNHDLRHLGPAGSGRRIGRRRRCVGVAAGGGGGGGCAVGHYCDGVTVCGWDIRKAREDFSFGLGNGPVAVAVRTAGLTDGRGIERCRGLNPALPRGHGNALLLFTG